MMNHRASTHLDEGLTEMEMSEVVGRLARLEAGQEHLHETLERNREEGKHDRNGLRQSMDAISKKLDEQTERLNGIFKIYDQATGMKKLALWLFAIASAFGLAGVYQVLTWFGFVRPPHP